MSMRTDTAVGAFWASYGKVSLDHALAACWDHAVVSSREVIARGAN